MSEKEHRDAIGELEGVCFEALRESVDLAHRLEVLCRTNRAVGLALAELREKEHERLLVQVMRAEHHRRRGSKAAKRGGGGRRR